MARIHITRSHQLGLPSARERITSLAEQIGREFDTEHEWQGDELRFKRSGASGSIVVTDDQVTVDVKLGLLLAAMKGRIESTISERLDAEFGRA